MRQSPIAATVLGLAFFLSSAARAEDAYDCEKPETQPKDCMQHREVTSMKAEMEKQGLVFDANKTSCSYGKDGSLKFSARAMQRNTGETWVVTGGGQACNYGFSAYPAPEPRS